MRKLAMPNTLDLDRKDPGWPASADIIIDTYWNYRRRHQYPATGGYFDQDTHIIDAFKLMDDQVEWYKQHGKKRGDLPAMEDIFAKRREHLRGDD